jgi:UDP-sugar transporter A1/2/3
MHYSRVSTPSSKAYSPAAAVLLNEVIKGSISFLIAFTKTAPSNGSSYPRRPANGFAMLSPLPWTARLRQLNTEIFAPDCLKLSIPAILYVIQNSLQFVAISNLPVASFQVAYQMKIMTTAAFSVALLGRRLSRTKWMALLFLAVGVGIVQVQTAVGNMHNHHDAHSGAVGSAAAAAPRMHVMNPLKGFAAVTAACFTSGLAGVYFEMVLKNSKADLWVRNVQLSLFSLLPAVLPIIYSASSDKTHSLIGGLFNNFGFWAWATVSIQVFGGLVTAVVIKYSDNILKGFATSLSIILSFLASVILFDFQITPAFLLGSSTVLAATWLYNQPAPSNPNSKESPTSASSWEKAAAPAHTILPISRDESVLGHSTVEKPSLRTSLSMSFGSSQSLVGVFGVNASDKSRPGSPSSSEPSTPGSIHSPTSHSGKWRI